MFRPKSPLKPSKQGINAMLLIGGLGASFLLITTLIIALSTKELDAFLFWFNLAGFSVLIGVIRLVMRRPGMYELPPPPDMPTNVDPNQGYYVPPAYVNHSPGPFVYGADKNRPFAYGADAKQKPQLRLTRRGKFALTGTFTLSFILLLVLLTIIGRTNHHLSTQEMNRFFGIGVVVVVALSPNVLRLPGMREPKP